MLVFKNTHNCLVCFPVPADVWLRVRILFYSGKSIKALSFEAEIKGFDL